MRSAAAVAGLRAPALLISGSAVTAGERFVLGSESLSAAVWLELHFRVRCINVADHFLGVQADLLECCEVDNATCKCMGLFSGSL